MILSKETHARLKTSSTTKAAILLPRCLSIPKAFFSFQLQTCWFKFGTEDVQEN